MNPRTRTEDRGAGFHRLVAAFLVFMALVASALLAQADEGDAGATSGVKAVRLDLQAGAFLDPLPFDRAFLISGRVPNTALSVEVRAKELLGEVFTFGGDPGRVRAFEGRALALLDTALAGEGAVTAAEIERLRGRLTDLLVEVAAPGGRRGWRLAENVLPWNWGRWAGAFARSAGRVIAPGTVFDADGPPQSALFRFAQGVRRVRAAGSGRERERALRDLAADVASTARSARIASVSVSSRSRPPARWSRLQGRRQSAPDSVRAPPFGRSTLWNRLEQRLRPVEQPEDGTVAFHVLNPALEADRFYLFEVSLVRELTDAEADAFKEAVKRRLREAARGRPFDGEGFRADAVEAVEGIAGGGRFVASGTLFDLRVPYDEVQPHLTRIVAPALDADGADRAVEAVASELKSMVQDGDVTHRTTLVVDTGANDYISADAGLVYAGKIRKSAVYLGANFYLHPVNKDVPLGQKGGFRRRFAFTLGLTLQGIADARGTRENLFHTQAMVLGAGYRVSQYIRAGGGWLVFRERDPASFPLTRDTRVAVTPYVSVSFDVDVGAHLKRLGGLLGFLKEKDDE